MKNWLVKILIAGAFLVGGLKGFSQSNSTKIDSCYKEIYDKYGSNEKIPNYHLASSKIAGKHFEEYKEYEKFALKNPAFIRFGNAIYSDNCKYNNKALKKDKTTFGLSSQKMLPIKDKSKVDSIAQELYKDFCKENKVDPNKAVNFSRYPHFTGSNFDTSGIGNYNDWVGLAYAGNENYSIEESKENGGKFYSPKETNALHELNHLQRWDGKSVDGYNIFGGDPKIATKETATRINEIINKDLIYKKINNISLDSVVIYPEKIPCNKGRGIEIGLIANKFREWKNKYGTVEECLMSDEGQSFIKQYYRNSKIF